MEEIARRPADVLAVMDESMEALAAHVEGIRDGQTARECNQELHVLEAMLGDVTKLGVLACQFCYLEARMLVNIAALGEDVGVRDEMVAWLRGKGEDEVNEILAECATGIRVSNIKRRETRARNSAARSDEQVAEFNRVSDEIIAELEETGRTRISPMAFNERWGIERRPDPKVMRGCVERTRDRALNRGAASTGTGDGDYMMLSVASQDEVELIVRTRLQSMHDDMLGLAEILRDARLALTPRDTARLRADLDMLEDPDD